MVVNMMGLVYSGTYTCEGHSISFIINEDDTVKIVEVSEMQTAPIGKTYTSTREVHIDDAIEIQNEYIKLGYDKIS